LKSVGVSGIFCLLVGAILSNQAYAQSDTVWLQEVVVSANDPAKYLPGGKQQIFTTDSVALQNLAQVIEDQVPVYFIQYGAPGQLSSINLRGLGASRTSLRWQGMEINSFTLGQTDFSEIAAGSGDLIKIQYGGVGAMFGNGALGGTVDISSQPGYNKGHSVALNSSVGSYGYWGTSVNYRYSNKKLSSSTKLFQRQAQNDFKYELAGSEHRQGNAGFQHYGISQDLTYIVNGYHLLSAHFWYNKHERDIQPNKNDFSGDDELQSENSRIALSWQWNANNWLGKLQGGFTDDLQVYNHSERTRLYRWFGSYEVEWKQSKAWTLRTGGNLNYLKPKVDSYQDNTKETRSELFASAIWEQLKNVSVGMSIRTPMANGEFKTISPLFSGEYRFFTSQCLKLSADLQVGKSYRLPTLNDLYWSPGGNPDLKAETSNNFELGLDMKLIKHKWTLLTNARLFRHKVDNWIIWIPGGRDENSDGEITSFWYPDNIREVLATGIEYRQTVNWQLPLPAWRTSLDVNGVFNKAVNKNTLSPVDRSKDKQLPYTPLHVINGSWKWFYGKWNLGVVAQFRSKRFMETNNELTPLPKYTLWRFQVGKTGSLGSLDWGLQFLVNNAFNEIYETFENRAMPGRNYQLNISITFN